jgi:diadenylate cyclase
MELLPPLTTLGGLLQVLIFSAAIYTLLSFLRSTRGTGMVRGLGVAFLGLGFTLWLLATLLDLAEVLRVFDVIAEVAVIVLAILFHPELRRGITRLGDHEVLGRFLRRDRSAVIEEITSAAVSMAKARVGALIAIERRAPLETYVERAVPIGATVTRDLLEAIFHPGNRLHDGAVVIRADRVEAAACILPLTENQDLGKTVGTRHRAALGLSEETDAVVVVVSEETGAISLCQEGRMERRVAKDALEGMLTRALAGADAVEPEEEPASLGTRAAAWLRARPGEKLIALAVGLGIYAGAWRSGRTVVEHDLELRVRASQEGRQLAMGQVVLMTPEALNASLLDAEGRPQARAAAKVRISGPRELLASLGSGLAGRVELTASGTGNRDLEPSEVRWVGIGEADAQALDVTWVGEAPRLELRAYETLTIDLGPDLVPPLDTTSLDAWELDEPRIVFLPSAVRVRAPRGMEPAAVRAALGFQSLALPAQRNDQWRQQPRWSGSLRLTDEARAEGLDLLEPVSLLVPVTLRAQELEALTLEVAVVSLDPASAASALAWEPPSGTVTLSVRLAGVSTGEDALDTSILLGVRSALQDQARAFVDVGGLTVETRDVPVQVQVPELRSLLSRIPGALEALGDQGAEVLETRLEPRTVRLVPLAESSQDDRQE